jgi:hypothetical protein
MAERSKELIQVGYYLSKYGQQDPPMSLGTDKWNEAYRMFYDVLNGGRAVLEFEHSLKNSRDAFDSYFQATNREGWKGKDGHPAKLTGFSVDVYQEFLGKDENYILSIIKPYFDKFFKVNSTIFNDLIAEDNANSDLDSTVTEGGVRVRISKSIERSPKLRQQALNIHGCKCQVCDFDFELTYGKWGKGFAEVHHLIPLSELKGEKQKTDPKKDLAVLCSNCHRMIHRKKNLTLTIDELKSKLIECSPKNNHC